MKRFNILIILCFTLLIHHPLSGREPASSCCLVSYDAKQDTILDNQILYNGIVWRNFYFKVREDQFLFSKEFLPGSITISGKSFKNINIRYDIYSDEIMTLSNHMTILQINKEMVDSFTLIFNTKVYLFEKIEIDSVKGLEGYCNVLYKGKSSLYIKYKKKIEPLAVEHKYDLFYQIQKVYLVIDGQAYSLSGKRDLLKLLSDKKDQLKGFIKENKIKISKSRPESYIPVITFYDKHSQ